jgi:hypothetical protein
VRKHLQFTTPSFSFFAAGDFVMARSQAGTDVNGESFQTRDAFDHMRIHGNRRRAALSLGLRPIPLRVARYDHDRIIVDVGPLQRRQFAHAQPAVDRHVDHRGIRFGHELDERLKLGRSEKRFDEFAALVGRQA